MSTLQTLQTSNTAVTDTLTSPKIFCSHPMRICWCFSGHNVEGVDGSKNSVSAHHPKGKRAHSLGGVPNPTSSDRPPSRDARSLKRLSGAWKSPHSSSGVGQDQPPPVIEEFAPPNGQETPNDIEQKPTSPNVGPSSNPRNDTPQSDQGLSVAFTRQASDPDPEGRDLRSGIEQHQFLSPVEPPFPSHSANDAPNIQQTEEGPSEASGHVEQHRPWPSTAEPTSLSDVHNDTSTIQQPKRIPLGASAQQVSSPDLPDTHAPLSDIEQRQPLPSIGDPSLPSNPHDDGTSEQLGSSQNINAGEPASSQSPQSSDDATIAIMGATGTGKTSFIRLITQDDNIIISDSLESQTSDLCCYPCDHPSGRKVTFIDTPGFDDSRDDTTDADVLGKISAFLDTEYKNKRYLSGVIYMHNIANTRMGGISRRNLKMFQKLVGNDSLCNVIIVTTMWGTMDKAIGEKREEELKSKAVFFKPLLEQKAQIFRHDSGMDSAERIVNTILENHPRVLLIQTELSEPGSRLVDTSAGVEIVEEFERLDERDRKKLETLAKELEEAHGDGDDALVVELEEKRDKLRHNIDGRKQDRTILERDADELDLFYGIRAGYRASGISGAIIGGIAGAVGSVFLSQAKETEERAGTSKEHSVTQRVARYAAETEELVEEMAEIGRDIGGSPGAFIGGLFGAIFGTTGSIMDGSSHVDEHIGRKN